MLSKPSDFESHVIWGLAAGTSATLLYWKWLRYNDMPHAGLWWMWLHIWDTRNAASKMYDAYKKHGIVKVCSCTSPLSFKNEVIIFDLDDCLFCHRNEGSSPGGAGDILFARQTRYFGSDGPNNGLSVDSHGRRMFGRGHGHNLTRLLVDGTPMRSSPFVLQSAKRCVDFVERYPDIMDWIRFHQIDMFMSVMIGSTPDLVNPETVHPLRQLPEDEEHAFVSSLLLSIFPLNLFLSITSSLENRFVKAMNNMTGLGVKELRDRFLSLPVEQRPESFMKSLLEKETVQDAEELMALFITAFQGNISLTLQNIVFHLANNQDAQEKLYRECVEACKLEDPTDAPMPYLIAIHKESHRLTPITDLTQLREYDRDLVLPSGYKVKAGTKIMMLNQSSIRDPDLVPNVDEFIPERYLGTGVDKNLSHYLQFSEFGSSSRACLGRRTARIMLKSVIIELFTRYRLDASPANKSFRIDPKDPAFNRIENFPKIILHPREAH